MIFFLLIIIIIQIIAYMLLNYKNKFNWTIFYIISEDDTSGISPFFMDLNELSKNFNYENIQLCILYTSRHFHGSYEIYSSKNKFIFHPININSTLDINIINKFIEKNQEKYDADKFAIFFGMHCSFWYISPGEYKNISVSDIRKIFKKKHYEIIGFDCCYMSTIEVLYELKDCANYIITCQYSSPSLGLNTNKMITAFGDNLSTEMICYTIAKSFLERIDHAPKIFESATDVSICCLKYVNDFVNLYKLCDINYSEKFKEFKIENLDDYPVYDLKNIILSSNITDMMKTKLLLLFDKIIIFYGQSISLSLSLSNKKQNGLSIIFKNLDEITYGHTYNDLEFSNINTK